MILVGAPIPATGAIRTFYVDPAGSDAAAGTAEAPWKTLQRAANTVLAGDLVIVRAGHYAGFDLRTSGTGVNPIEFRAEPGVVVDTPNPITPNHGINLEAASWILIQGFKVTAMPRAGIRAVLDHHVTIRGNTMDANGYWGFLSGFSDDLLIEDNETSHSQNEHGIYVSNSGDRPIIRRNHVWGNHAAGIHMNGDLSQGGDGIITGALVEANVLHDNGVAGGSAINADGVQGSRFQNNLIYGNHASGISLYRIDGGDGSKNNVVAHNTIVQAADARWALNISDGATGNTVLDNILYNAHSFRGSVIITSDSFPGLVSDWNVVMNRFSIDDGSNQTLAQWRTATGQDIHSFVAVPAALFVNPGANDYHLSASSPARDAGLTLADVTEDLEGVPRPSGDASDIGAYEVPAGPPLAVTVIRRGSAAGTVTSQPAGIDCGGICGASFVAGTTVTLTAAPTAAATFAHWSGACTGTAPMCTFTMTATLMATATFAQVFTDAPLVSGTTPLRVAHVAELRAAVENLRMWRGLSAFVWADPALVPGVTQVRAVHIVELRSALDAVYDADGLDTPAWSAAPVTGQTPVTAAHLEELRLRVRAVE